MSHIPTAELARITGYTKRQIQRIAGSFPGAVRTVSGHWQIPDTQEVRERCAAAKRGRDQMRTASERKDFEFMKPTLFLMREKGADFDEACRIAWVAGMRRRIRIMRKSIDENYDVIPPKSLILQIRKLGELLVFQSECWERANSAG